MKYVRKELPTWIKPYFAIFAAVFILSVAASVLGATSVAEMFLTGPMRERTLDAMAGSISLVVLVQILLVLRAHVRALKSLVVLLLIALISILATYTASSNPQMNFVPAIFPLAALWLLNTRRFGGLWKRLCVMRRRRTRQRRLIRQLKRTRRR
ncbi:hypothetical protein DQ397_000675 [Pseudomonas sp. CK-NBRI-02]|uniref:hypothetical protein n=1 Tax=Pseudomonas sp. CK-NBRI-02 TaxID=2249759 RepID=UPI0005BAA091|nr:hypothetical protein [Pseudomonas sp. CK-NBRI-02]TYO83919.1 hypothetical protein DQ397_000675 [Pseudomonas sp. CK-NBRI-02]